MNGWVHAPRQRRKPESEYGPRARAMRDQWPEGRFGAPDGVDDLSGEKCRCGLRLPCNNCIYRNTANDVDSREIGELKGEDQ